MSAKIQTNPSPVHHLAQLSYAIHLLGGRSVLLLSEETGLAGFIAETGAQVVQVTEAEPTPANADMPGFDCHRHPLETLNFEDDVFGAAVIPNLTALPDAASTLREVRRILNKDGYLLVAVPNPEAHDAGGMDYYALYDMLASLFDVVQMVGQSPFGGYAVEDLSCEEADFEIGFNTDILGDETETIEWFIAICGRKPAALDPYSIIQIPSKSRSTASNLEAELAAAKLELSNRGVRIESLEKKLEEELMQSEEARARAVKIAKEFDNERKANTKRQLEDEFSRRSQDIDLQSAVREVKKELRLAIERANSAEAARDEIIDRMRADTNELDRLRSRVKKLESEKQSGGAAPSQELVKQLRLAEDRARSAEAARDEFIDRLRADASELEKLRRRVSEMDAAPAPAPPVSVENNGELKKQLRLAEERARSAEAARDEIIDRLRADASELERLRTKVEQLTQAKHEVVSAALDPALKERLETAEAEVAALRAERDAIAATAERDAAALDAKHQEVASLNAKLTAQSQTEETLRATVRQLESELEALARPPEASPPEPAGDADEAPDAEAALKAEIETLQQEIFNLETQLNQVAKERSDQADEAARLECLVRDLIVKLEAETAQSTAPSHTSREGHRDNTSAAFGPDDYRIADLEDEIAALWGAKAGEHRARVEAELELSSKVVELENAKASLTTLNVHLKSKDEELKRLSSDKERLTTELHAAAAEAERFAHQQMHIAELEGELQSLKWRVDELNARNQMLVDELDAGIQTTDELRTTIAEMEADTSKPSAKERRYQSVERTLQSCISSINSLYETNRALSGKVAAQVTIITNLSADAERQRRALEAAVRRERLLDEELDSQRARANRLKADLEAATARITEIETELTEVQIKREQLQNESSRIREELESTKHSRRETVDKMESAKQDATTVKTTLEAAQIELRGAHDQISELKRVIAKGESVAARQLAETLSTLDRERAASMRIKETLKATENRLNEEISRVAGLNAAVTVLKADLQHESELMRLAGADAARASGEVSALREKIAQSQRRLREKDAEIEIDLRVIADLRAALDSVSKKLKARPSVDIRVIEADRQRIKALEEEIAALTKLLESKKAEVLKRESEKSLLEQNLKETTDEAEQLRAQIEGLKHQTAEAQHAADGTLTDLERQLEEEKAQKTEALHHTEQALEQLRQQLVDAEASKSAAVSDLEAKLAALQHHLDEADLRKQEALLKADKDMRELQENLALMEGKLGDLNQSKVDLSVELADTIEEVERLNKRLRSNLETEDALKTEIDILKDQLREAHQNAAEASKETKESSTKTEAALAEAQQALAEKEAIITSLTDQLEEREHRSVAMEKENRLLTEQIREHEIDVSAWNMELKLRSARISQLEKEIDVLKRNA